MNKPKVTSFYRVVKAQRGHQFSGLWAVEKVFFRDGKFLKKQIVHEWDMRIISEAILARLGGQDAYENFLSENDDIADLGLDENVTEAEARDVKEIKLTKRTLTKELKLKPEVEE